MPRTYGDVAPYGKYSEWELVASAARTASGDSGVIEGFGPASKLRLQLDVTAASGTSPTLDVVLEDSLDGANWNPVTGGAFTRATAVTREVINVTNPVARRVRVRWEVGGTGPSFTFAVHAAAVA